MTTSLFSRYRDAIARYPLKSGNGGRQPAALPDDLLLSRDALSNKTDPDKYDRSKASMRTLLQQ
jgi:hypothetical protein